ncbi:MAG: NYN domain-containing protein [Deltaproteobacteria bacterium]|nr:NYN domain-containing protein [Deltaproteobacteria bacterium]
MAAPQTPKPRSAQFNELYRRLCGEVDAPTLVVLLYSALDRGRLEAIYNHAAPREGARAQMLGKEELVGAVGGWFFASLDVAHAVVRDLDRVCLKERHIVASLPDGKIAERLQGYQALDFRRERARLTWALLRDDRSEAQRLAGELIQELVDSMRTSAPASGPAGAEDDARVQALKQRLDAYESQVNEARGQLQGLEGRVAQLERERAELMVAVGRKENALRAEERLRREAEAAAQRAERRLRELEEQRAAGDPGAIQRLTEERDRLAHKLRHLEKKGRAALDLEALRAENEQLQQRLADLEQQAQVARGEHQSLLQTLVVRDRATQERLTRLRDALKTARRMALTSDEEALPRPPRREERVGLFVDAANAGASALRACGRQFDFGSVLDLVGERERAVAIAYVVDNGQPGFEKFAHALREMGYTVKVKRPSQRPDGTVKADWDMALAMDVIEARHRVDSVLIVSGDGDFVPLVRRLKRWRKRVEVAAFEHAIHPELRRTADAFWPLDINATT